MAAALQLHLHRSPAGRPVGRPLSHVIPNFSSGHGHAFGCEYLELQPYEYIRYTDRCDDPGLPGVMEVSAALKPVLCGTELSVVRSGIPEVIPLEMCSLGWQESLAQLATLESWQRF